MARPPQPAVYVFLIDVSHSAIQSGMVATATRTILENLDRLPDEDGRTKVAIIAFDVSLYFFSLPVSELLMSLLFRLMIYEIIAWYNGLVHARCF